jgi:hypothetical protein
MTQVVDIQSGIPQPVKHFAAEYEFTLTAKQQQDWQTWLRALPNDFQDHYVWKMLHGLSYPKKWVPRP